MYITHHVVVVIWKFFSTCLVASLCCTLLRMWTRRLWRVVFVSFLWAKHRKCIWENWHLRNTRARHYPRRILYVAIFLTQHCSIAYWYQKLANAFKACVAMLDSIGNLLWLMKMWSMHFVYQVFCTLQIVTRNRWQSGVFYWIVEKIGKARRSSCYYGAWNCTCLAATRCRTTSIPRFVVFCLFCGANGIGCAHSRRSMQLVKFIIHFL